MKKLDNNQTIKTGVGNDKGENKLVIKTVPIESLVLQYIPEQGDLIQKSNSKGLKDVSVATNKVPDFEFNCVKLFLIDTDKATLTTSNLILDINEVGRELYKVLSVNKGGLVLEHLVTKQPVKIVDWESNPNLYMVVGEISNPFVLNKIISGEFTSDEEDISPLIEEERQLNIKLTNEWLADETNKKILLSRARVIDKAFKKKGFWFNLHQFSKEFKAPLQQSLDELNLLKLGGHLVAKFDFENEEEIYLIVFTDKQRIDKLESIKKDLLKRVEEVDLEITEIKLKQN